MGAAFKNPTTFENEPSGFSGSEWGARMTGMGLKGLGQGLNNYSQQNSQLRRPSSGTGDMGGAGQQSMWPSYMGQAQDSLNGATRKPNPYFFGYGNS